MNGTYAINREQKRSFRYRLQKRSIEVIKVIQEYFPNFNSIIDFGTAEGKMLKFISEFFNPQFCVGLDICYELLKIGKNKYKNICYICANVEALEFIRDESFDIVIATAIIEHLNEPRMMLREAYRILRNKGLIIVTTPHHFWDKIARILGFIQGEHCSVMSRNKVVDLLKEENFIVIKHYGFMMSPFGFKSEEKVEKFFYGIKLDTFLLNQMIIGKKK